MRKPDRFGTSESTAKRGALSGLQEAGRAPIARAWRARATLFATASIVVVVDQLSKAWVVANLSYDERIPLIGAFFGIRLTTNPGGAFGMLPGATAFFFWASLAIVVVVIFWALRDAERPGAFGLVLGGGIGNLIDRIVRPPAPMRGRVVDFLDISFWPTFNLADSAIVLGVIVLFAAALLKPSQEKSKS